MVIVTGAAGRTGGEVVRLLAARGIRVRALVRDPQRTKGLTGPAVEIAVGDLSRPVTLDPAFRGADKLFLASSPDPDVATLHGNAIDAAKRAGIKHIVRLSAFGASPQSPWLLLRVHGDADEHLSRSGIAYTILRAQSFFQNTLAYAATVASDGMFAAPTKDGAVGMIDSRDVAQVAAHILASGGHSGRIYDLTGPEPLSHAQVAQRLGAALGREVRYVDVPRETAREAMLGTMPEWLVDGYLDILGTWSSGKYSEVSDAHERITGKKPRPFDQFAKDFAGAFGGVDKAEKKAEKAEKAVAG